MPLTYRHMTIADYDQLIALWADTPGIGLSDADEKKNIGYFLSRNPGLSFVCETDGKIIGTVICANDGRRGYLYHLAVDDAYRKKGIGKELVRRSLEELRNQGITRCHLFLYNDNETAIRFYEKTGWRKRGNLLIYSKDI